MSGHTLNEWSDRVRELLGNPSDGRIGDAALQEHVRGAIRRFSADRPAITYVDFAGNGASYDILVSSLTGWVNGFSTVGAIEYPQGQRIPVYLDPQSWVMYPDTSLPTAVRLLTWTPASGQTARVYYTLPWAIPDTTPATDVIPDTSYDPVARLAGYFGALQLAGRASGTQRDSFAGADLVGESTEETRWMDLSRSFLASYTEHVGGTEGEPPAMATTDWDARSTWIETGHRFLLRPSRR